MKELFPKLRKRQRTAPTTTAPNQATLLTARANQPANHQHHHKHNGNTIHPSIHPNNPAQAIQASNCDKALMK
jgi:hypothetical protein